MREFLEQELNLTLPGYADSRMHKYLAGVSEAEQEILKGLIKEGWTAIEVKAQQSKAKGFGGEPFDELFPSSKAAPDGKVYRWPIVKWIEEAKAATAEQTEAAKAAAIAEGALTLSPSQMLAEMVRLNSRLRTLKCGEDAYWQAEAEERVFRHAVQRTFARHWGEGDLPWLAEFVGLIDKAHQAADEWMAWAVFNGDFPMLLPHEVWDVGCEVALAFIRSERDFCNRTRGIDKTQGVYRELKVVNGKLVATIQSAQREEVAHA